MEQLQERHKQLAALADRKEAFALKLAHYIAEIGQGHDAIRAEEKQLVLPGRARSRQTL